MNDESYNAKMSNGNAPFRTEISGSRSLSSNGSSLSVSPSSHMMESSASSKLLDSVPLLNEDELNSSPSSLSKKQQQPPKVKMDKFDSLPKPFYLSSLASSQQEKPTFEPIKFDPIGAKQAKNVEPISQHSPVSTRSSQSQSQRSSDEDSEALQKPKELERRRSSFAKPSVSMDANNNYESTDPEEVEKKKAVLKEELGARLSFAASQCGDNHVHAHARMHKSASIAIDNMNYVQLADLQTMMDNGGGAHESPKFPQPTIQSYYLSQLSDDKKNEYKVNKLVSPTYKPFSAYSAYMKYTQPNVKGYIAKLDDPSKPSMTQSRSFKLLQETLENGRSF